MRILLLAHSFNSLSQRIHAELTGRGHMVSVEFDIADSVTEEAVGLFRPDLIIAPFLKRAIPASVWQATPCLIVHPGIVGDRGPSSLDWAIQDGVDHWGVTLLQAIDTMDAGPVWAWDTFPMRPVRKAALYRREVTEAAVRCVLQAIEQVPAWRAGRWSPLDPAEAGAQMQASTGIAPGQLRPLMRQTDRAFAWTGTPTADILRRIRAADGFPGVESSLFGQPCRIFDAHAEPVLRGEPGQIIARRETALCVATVDGAVWIGHVRLPGPHGFKRPASEAFGAQAAALPELPAHAVDMLVDGSTPGMAVDTDQPAGWQDIRYREEGPVGILEFDFYNGAMGTEQCRRLRDAFIAASSRPTRVIVLAGGSEFWSNGIHLNRIEAAESPADESWDNINAIDDVAEAILRCNTHWTVAALRGNAGAGGCFLARAADEVWAHPGVVLNPHYRNMGNLYGSEFWTYSLPRRVGREAAQGIMRHRLPMPAAEALAMGFIDAVMDGDDPWARMQAAAQACARSPDLAQRLGEKAARRERDEADKPLVNYRAEELAHMRRNFYGFDPSYHVARYRFVFNSAESWTPRHLARHRDLGWVVPD